MTDLPKIAEQLPQLEDVIIDGHSVLVRSVIISRWSEEGRRLGVVNNEDDLEDLMLAAERVALEHRLDVMNRGRACTTPGGRSGSRPMPCRGVFNVTLTNQFLTPPTTTNPFALPGAGQAVLARASTPSCPWSGWPSGTTSAPP